MKPWALLDTAQIPGSAGKLRLLQRGNEYSIRLAEGELMNSRVRGSEQALARLGCAKIEPLGRPRILIGGFGMGFTLRAALDLLPATSEVTVAELVPTVVSWGRGPLAELSGNSLTDARVRIHEGDVGRLVRSVRSSFDAILLDVDNGPEGMTRQANDRLYDRDGLRAFWKALQPGGVLAVWSAVPDTAFAQRLRRAGFSVDEVAVRANVKRGSRHIIWVAARSEMEA